MEKVLVTGGAGFIGSHTVDRLLIEGLDVVVLDNLSHPNHNEGKIPNYLPIENIQFIEGDVRDKELMKKALQDVSIVYHFAAYQDYLPDFSKFFHVNSFSTALIYELVVEYSLPIKKIIVASSQAVMGEGKHECKEHGDFIPDLRDERDLKNGLWEIKCPHCDGPIIHHTSDESVINPKNQYAMSKYSQEQIAINLGRQYEIPSVALRYSIVQGSRQSFSNAYSGVMRIFSLSLYNKHAPIIYEDGEQIRDFININDVVDANLLMLETDSADYNVYNVGGGIAYTVNEFYKRLASQYDTDIEPIRNGNYRHGDTRNIVSDISKIKKLGWSPKRDLEESIISYKEYLEEESPKDDVLNKALETMKSLSVVR
ncbi:SDR family NAD(P)-dependent oxidoreductase [Candidatus Marinimicrobia bacterium MT.SAG.4]|nr:SDR family NAD(P)-dependent oxidoreductase [Candidatus Marinimicrobia bacterium MT.SAG.4]